MKRRKKFVYFYYNGKLHKTLSANRAQNTIWAWSYSEGKRYVYELHHVRRYGERAFSTSEVVKILRVSRNWIVKQFNENNVYPPERSYNIEGDLGKGLGRYRFSRKKILELHDLMLDNRSSTKRIDGLVTNDKRVPSRREVELAMDHGIYLYAKTEDGQFVPVWDSEDFK